MARDLTRLGERDWLQRVEAVEADVTRPETLGPALEGVDIAYYLVHSMAGGQGFEETDVRAAEDFGRVARAAGVARIIYLGGLGDPGQGLSYICVRVRRAPTRSASPGYPSPSSGRPLLSGRAASRSRWSDISPNEYR